MQMAPTYFPLRWESTGDQWWYASPIDWAAANGHYDLVRELLRMDGNHLMKLTSLRRIRRLETVWDDDEQFHGAAKCRSSVARRLFHDCEPRHHKQQASSGKNSLLKAGYGGWLIYTAASAGDLGFVRDLLERNPLLVFGEGEYGITDVLYAAARSKSRDVFAAVMESAEAAKGGDVYRWEVINRGVHAAARGGNLAALKELVLNCSDVLAYRDAVGSTLLHTASARAQVEVIKFLIASFEKITASTDDHGNTALHIAAFRGQLAAVEVLIKASPTLIYAKNNAGETFLHKAVSGFQTVQFRRLDRQIDLLRRLVRGAGAEFRVGAVINAKSNEQRTALHLAVIGNVHSDLVQLLMTADGIDVNAADADGLTPLDYLRQKPRSASSDVLIRQLISAGADDHFHRSAAARKIIVSRLKLQQGNGSSSPGSSFRIPDAEIFLYTGMENASDFFAGSGSIMSPASPGRSPSHHHRRNSSSNECSAPNLDNRRSSFAGSAKPSSVNNAAQIFKQALLNLPNKLRDRKSKHINNNKSIDYDEVPIDYHQPNKPNATELEPPTPLRKRFSKPSSPSPSSSNKRTLAVRSNQSSPTSSVKKKKKKMRNCALQAMAAPRRSSRSSSFSKSSISSSSPPPPMEKQKGVCVERDIAGPSSCPSNSKRMKSQYYLCFGNAGLSVKSPVTTRPSNNGQSFKGPVSLVA